MKKVGLLLLSLMHISVVSAWADESESLSNLPPAVDTSSSFPVDLVPSEENASDLESSSSELPIDFGDSGLIYEFTAGEIVRALAQMSEESGFDPSMNEDEGYDLSDATDDRRIQFLKSNNLGETGLLLRHDYVRPPQGTGIKEWFLRMTAIGLAKNCPGLVDAFEENENITRCLLGMASGAKVPLVKQWDHDNYLRVTGNYLEGAVTLTFSVSLQGR